jgi:hypothetical protein
VPPTAEAALKDSNPRSLFTSTILSHSILLAMTSILPTAETWHPHYDDPDGGLILVSKEGVKFGTSAKLLAKQG